MKSLIIFMKPKSITSFASALLVSSLASFPTSMSATALTWDGGGVDNNWSTDANWVGDPVADPANGDTLTFAGTTRLAPNNDLTGLILANASNATAFTFSSGAGAFVLSGNAITVGTTTANTNVVYQQSASNVEIQNNLTFAGNQRDRNIGFTASTGTVTLSGNVDFKNDIIGLGRNSGANTSAGTLVLSGNNTGDGKGAQISAGGNQLRAMLWTAVAGNRVVIGSDTALGNAGSGSAEAGNAVFKGILAGQQLYISTANGARNLSNSSFGITNRIDFDGADNLTIGNVINSGGNRDLWVTDAGKLTISNGLFLSNDANGRSLFFNVTGSGGAEVTGKIYDTFSNTGGTFATMASLGILRKAGAGVLTLSGNSSFLATVQVEGGTLKLGHANALGSSDAASFTSIRGGTLDLNGLTIAEKIWSDTGTNVIANSSATAASVTTDIGLSNSITFNNTGDITATRLIGTANRTVTKQGSGTLTTNGTSHNNLTAWDIQAGTVVFANTSGLASDRGTTLNGGTLRLSGSNSNLINDSQAFTINSGSFDLNGKAEAVTSIGGSGGNVTNSNATTATLYVGGGTGGSSSATYAGVIQNGTGILKLTKEGSGTQTLSGTNTYTGATTINGGTLALASGGSIDNTSEVNIASGAQFDVSAKSGYSVSTLKGTGEVVGALTVSTQLAIGNSPGTMTFDSLTLGSSSTYLYELTGGGITADLGIVDGNLTLASGSILDLIQLGTYTGGDKFTLFAYTGTLTGTFTGLADDSEFSDAGGIWRINYNDTTAGLNGGSAPSYVTITAVPEPAAILLGSLGLIALLGRRR